METQCVCVYVKCMRIESSCVCFHENRLCVQFADLYSKLALCVSVKYSMWVCYAYYSAFVGLCWNSVLKYEPKGEWNLEWQMGTSPMSWASACFVYMWDCYESMWPRITFTEVCYDSMTKVCFTYTYNGIQNSTFTCGIRITLIPLNLSTKTYFFEVINSECRLTAYTLYIKYDRLQPLKHKCWQCKLTNPASGEKMISYLKETLWQTSSCITVWPHWRSIQRLYTSSSHSESLSLKYLRNDPIKHSWLCKEHTENTGLLTLPVFPLKTSSLSIITSIEGRRVRERKSLAA